MWQVANAVLFFIDGPRHLQAATRPYEARARTPAHLYAPDAKPVYPREPKPNTIYSQVDADNIPCLQEPHQHILGECLSVVALSGAAY